MARPRKPKDQLHNIRLDVWLTEQQEGLLLSLSERRDVPKGIVAREALMAGLERHLASISHEKAA